MMKIIAKINDTGDWGNIKDKFNAYFDDKALDIAKVFCIEKPFVIFEMDAEKYKTQKQNRTFWSLIDCFWNSGVSSFNSYDRMIEYYYRIAGLIKIEVGNTLSKETKNMLLKAIKLLPIEDKEKEEIYDLLKGKVKKYLSWSVVEKDKAILAINTLLNDMDSAGVLGSKMGKKYQEILKGMGKYV